MSRCCCLQFCLDAQAENDILRPRSFGLSTVKSTMQKYIFLNSYEDVIGLKLRVVKLPIVFQLPFVTFDEYYRAIMWLK